MNEEETSAETSAFSYIWYSAIWYLIQFLIILGLHFRVTKEINKKIVQKAARDTLLLALVFLSLQWAQKCLSSAIYRLPYVILHLFVDLIPTALWISSSQLLLMMCLGIAQKLYNHLAGTKTNTSTIASHLTISYFTSLWKSQEGLDKAIRKHISKQYPNLSQRLDRQLSDSPMLTLLFKSAFLLLQLSTLGLAFINAAWSAMKECYHKVTQQKWLKLKTELYLLGNIFSVTAFAAAWIQYNTAVSTFHAAKDKLHQVMYSSKSSSNKSMKTNSEPSASEPSDTSNSFPSGPEDDANQFKSHDD